METEEIIEELKRMVISVNETLSYYDPGWSRLQRCPIIPREEVESFKQFIECRFNMEAFNSPIFREFAEYFDGYLFEVTDIVDEDDKKRRFSEVCVELTKTWDNFSDPYLLDENVSEDEEEKRDKFYKVTDDLRNLLGGDKIYFNYSQKKIKIRVL